ncbi:MAG: glycosyl hydrolase [Aurantibacter sp.]
MKAVFPFLLSAILFSCTPNGDSNPPEEVLEVENEENRLGPLDQESEQSNNFKFERSKSGLLTYFDTLIEKGQLIVGQHCGNGPDEITQYYNTYIDMLVDETGRHAGIMGADMGFNPSTNYPVQTLIDHWAQGGLITLSWHADNPFADGYDVYWNTVDNKDQINLKALLRDADHSLERTSYRTELDNIAGALQKLRDAGLTVIWRPFHEMNGDFFWWGANAYNNQQTNEADFKALWIDLYNTLTFDYGLDNLIWTYSVIPDHGWNADVTAFYPGSDYVDLVGMDYYGAHPNFPDYNALKSLGKTIVMSESGPTDAGYGNWNMMQLVNSLKGKAAYFLQWHSWQGAAVSIKDNQNVIEMMNSEAVITRDELLSTSF